MVILDPEADTRLENSGPAPDNENQILMRREKLRSVKKCLIDFQIIHTVSFYQLFAEVIRY